MLVLGIDDAGRGPLIGPMILAGVLIEKKNEPILRKFGVADSKLLEHKKRIELSKAIKESALSFHIVQSEPEQIDNAISSGINLNTLEAMKTAEIINNINDGKYKKQSITVIIDCPSININAWRSKLLEFIKHIDNLDVVCEHKADYNHPVVSAASILAKVKREEEVLKIKERFGEIGSGYPSDPLTKDFLKKKGRELENSGIFRKSRQTWKSIFPGKSQTTLEGF